MTGIGAKRIARAVGAVLAVAAVTGTAAVVAVDLPSIERSPLSITTRPQPATSVLSCAGPVVAAGRDAADVRVLQAAGDQEVVAGTTAGSPEAAGSEVRAVDVADAPAIRSFAAEPLDRVRTDAAAAGSVRVVADDLAGFAASACTPPAMESWLVGGSGETGAADLVLLANPGAVAAQVDLTVFGAEGRSAPDAGSSILVPAGEQRVVPLAAVALAEAAPVVLVTASQAPVQATLQSSLTRTLVPVGLDQGGLTGLPRPAQTVPAFSVVGSGDQAGETSVRLLAPSDAATATVTITEVGSAATAASFPDLSLEPGVPLEVGVGALAEGSYRVEVDASAPVVTGVHASTGADAGSDFAWYGSADDLQVPTLLAVADGPAPALSLVNPGADEVAAVLTDGAGAGEPREVRVPAGGSVSLDVRAGELYRLDPAGGTLRASVGFAAPDALAGYAVVPADVAAAPVEVRPR